MARLTAGQTQQSAAGSPADRPNGHPSVAIERRAILQAIGELTDDTGRPPTRRELLSYTGLSSHRRLTEAVTALEQAGRLRRLPGSRGLIVVRPTEMTE
jgi:SOS-response transcriptional repressor LexA